MCSSCPTAASAAFTRNCLIVYLHGFNSSPQSHKAQVMQRYMSERGLAHEYACPALPPLAREALEAIEPYLARKPLEGGGLAWVDVSLQVIIAIPLLVPAPLRL